MTEENINPCHLCGAPTENGGWCTNETCSEYLNDEDIDADGDSILYN